MVVSEAWNKTTLVPLERYFGQEVTDSEQLNDLNDVCFGGQALLCLLENFDASFSLRPAFILGKALLKAAQIVVNYQVEITYLKLGPILQLAAQEVLIE